MLESRSVKVRATLSWHVSLKSHPCLVEKEEEDKERDGMCISMEYNNTENLQANVRPIKGNIESSPDRLWAPKGSELSRRSHASNVRVRPTERSE